MQWIDNFKKDGTEGSDGIHDTLLLDKATYDLVMAGGDPDKYQYESMKASQDALAAQLALNKESLRLNTAMAWLQMAMGLSTKVSGR